MTKNSKFSRILFTIGGVLLTLAALYYLGDTLLKGVKEAGGLEELLQFHAGYFILSCALLFLHLLLAGWSWMLACRTAGTSITFKQAFNIHFLAQVGKYIPGKIWGAVGKVGLSKKEGITSIHIGYALVLETLFIISACVLMALPLLPDAASELGFGTAGSVIAASVGAVTILTIAHPSILKKVIELAGRVMKKDIKTHDPGFLNVLKLLPVYLLVFLSLGLAFFCFAKSFGLGLPPFKGMFLYPMAVGVGFIAIFSPGGLGIREVSLLWLILLLAPVDTNGILPPSEYDALTSLVSIAARIWITAGEAVAFLIAVALWRRT